MHSLLASLMITNLGSPSPAFFKGLYCRETRFQHPSKNSKGVMPCFKFDAASSRAWSNIPTFSLTDWPESSKSRRVPASNCRGLPWASWRCSSQSVILNMFPSIRSSHCSKVSPALERDLPLEEVGRSRFLGVDGLPAAGVMLILGASPFACRMPS